MPVGEVQTPIFLRLLASPVAGYSASFGGCGSCHFGLPVFTGKMEGVYCGAGVGKNSATVCVYMCLCVHLLHALCVTEVVSLCILDSMLARFFSSGSISGYSGPPAIWFVYTPSLHAGPLGQNLFPHQCDNQAEDPNLSTRLDRAFHIPGAA